MQSQDYREQEEPSRRDFMKYALGAGGALALGGCGIIDSVNTNTLSVKGGINTNTLKSYKLSGIKTIDGELYRALPLAEGQSARLKDFTFNPDVLLGVYLIPYSNSTKKRTDEGVIVTSTAPYALVNIDKVDDKFILNRGNELKEREILLNRFEKNLEERTKSSEIVQTKFPKFQRSISITEFGDKKGFPGVDGEFYSIIARKDKMEILEAPRLPIIYMPVDETEFSILETRGDGKIITDELLKGPVFVPVLVDEIVDVEIPGEKIEEKDSPLEMMKID